MVLKSFEGEDFLRPIHISRKTGLHPNNVSKKLKDLREHEWSMSSIQSAMFLNCTGLPKRAKIYSNSCSKSTFFQQKPVYLWIHVHAFHCFTTLSDFSKNIILNISSHILKLYLYYFDNCKNFKIFVILGSG